MGHPSGVIITGMMRLSLLASERPVIQTVMNVPAQKVHEIDPGHAVIVKKNGQVSMDKIRQPGGKESLFI